MVETLSPAGGSRSVDAWFRLTVFSLALLLLVLLAINTVAIVGLNLLYDAEELRPKHRWRPVLARNAILSLPCLVAAYFCRLTSVPAALTRIAAFYARLRRALVYLALAVAAVSSLVTGLENWFFHGVWTLTRTPSQALNLLYVGAVVLVAAFYLPRSRAVAAAASLPGNWAATLRSVAWDAVTTSALFAAVAGGVFAGGAYLFIPRSWDYMPLASGVYVFAGVLCGALAGGIHATRRRTGDIVRSSYQLTSPVMELLIHSVVAEGVGRSAPSMPALATDQPRTRFGRLAQRQLLRSVRRHWASNFFEGLDAAARSPAALEQFIAERVIAVTTADLERRSRWIFYAVCAGTAAVWALPAVIAKLVRAAA